MKVNSPKNTSFIFLWKEINDKSRNFLFIVQDLNVQMYSCILIILLIFYPCKK